MSVLVITPPEPIVSLDTAKAHLRVTTDDEDALITAYLEAAQSSLDGPNGWLGRAIGLQTLEWLSDDFPDGCTPLPFGPVQEVEQVGYTDVSGDELTVEVDRFVVRPDGRIRLVRGAAWPSHDGNPDTVRVRYVAGFDPVPAAVGQAILLLVGQWFRNRSAVNVGNIVNALPNGVEALLAPYRYFG